MECGLVNDGESVGSHGQAAPLFEAVDAAFDDVPLLVDVMIEGRRTAASPARPQTVANLIGRLRPSGPSSQPATRASERVIGRLGVFWWPRP